MECRFSSRCDWDAVPSWCGCSAGRGVGVDGAGLEGLAKVETPRFSGVCGRGVLGAVVNVVGTSGEEVVAWIRGGLRVWLWFGVFGV